MRLWSRREFLARKAWVDKQWNEPNRTDHYLMQIAQMLSTGNTSLQDFKLPFAWKTEENGQATYEEMDEETRKRRADEETRKAMAFFGPLVKIAERRTISGD